MWDMRMGEELLTFGLNCGSTTETTCKAVFLSDELYIARISAQAHNSDVCFYNAYTSKLVHNLQAHPGRVNNIEGVEDDCALVTACSDYRCRLYDIKIEALSDSRPVVNSVTYDKQRSIPSDAEELSIDL